MSDLSIPHCPICAQPEYACECADHDDPPTIEDVEEVLFDMTEGTQEELVIRTKLVAWCREQMLAGFKPIPIQTALMVVCKLMRDPDRNGIRKNTNRERLDADAQGV